MCVWVCVCAFSSFFIFSPHARPNLSNFYNLRLIRSGMTLRTLWKIFQTMTLTKLIRRWILKLWDMENIFEFYFAVSVFYFVCLVLFFFLLFFFFLLWFVFHTSLFSPFVSGRNHTPPRGARWKAWFSQPASQEGCVAQYCGQSKFEEHLFFCIQRYAI